jgi:hypothetical protein
MDKQETAERTITVGQFTISEWDDVKSHDGAKSVWIRKADGDGCQFSAKLLEEAIREFYEANL